jgi:hypothetical protein
MNKKIILLIIVFIVCVGIYVTQSYWINTAIKLTYKEYSLDNAPKEGTFILSGGYMGGVNGSTVDGYIGNTNPPYSSIASISRYINTSGINISEITCKPIPLNSNGYWGKNVKLLVVVEYTNNQTGVLHALKVVEGCNQ